MRKPDPIIITVRADLTCLAVAVLSVGIALNLYAMAMGWMWF